MLNLYPHHIFFEKVINQITHRKNKLWRFLPASLISVSDIGAIPDKQSFNEQVKGVLGDVAGAVRRVKEKEGLVITEAANQTLAHEFDYLGSGKVQMPKIRWHEDFKSGNAWKKGVFFLKQRQSTAKGADIKVPWELSRGHHLLWLGEAYLIRKDDRYAKEVVDEIEDWLNENPFVYSVNWACTMDVAIRAVNWMYAVAMVIDSPFVTESFIQKFYRSLYQHGWFIYNHFEQTIPYSNNHLFSDIAGMLYLSLLFKQTKSGKKWLNYSIAALFKEIRCQVLPSGVHYERSVSYHRLMTEMVVASVYLLKRRGVSVPADIEYRAGSMMSYIASYTKKNHLSPLVEDNDDGRFLPFVRRDFRQHDYLLDVDSAEILVIANGVTPISFKKEKGSVIYPDAGHAILRHGDAYLFVTNGEQSSYDNGRKTVGTHTHNDKLSFDLAIGSNDIIIDPGAYIYTPQPEKSNEFRSTLKHNTVVVDGEEQNIITTKNVFIVTKNSRATEFNMLSETRLGGKYKTFNGGLEHRRCFEVFEDAIQITDQLSKEGSGHSAILSFHLAPKLQAQIEDNIVALETENYHVRIVFDYNLKTELIDDTISPSYGVLLGAKTIRAKMLFDEHVVIKTRIQWSRKK